MIRPFSQDLVQSIKMLKPHDQICLLIQDDEIQKKAEMQFIKSGIDQGDRCVYVICDENKKNATSQLAKLKSNNPPLLIANGVLIFNRNDLALSDTLVKSQNNIIRFYENSLEEAQNSGFNNLRIIEDMSWASDKDISWNELLEYITALHRFFLDSPSLGLFLYQHQCFTSKTILDILKTHRLIMHDSGLFENAFYVTPEQYNTDHQARHEVESLLSGLKSLKKWEGEFLTTIQGLRGLVEINKTISGTLNFAELGNQVLNNIYEHLKPEAAAVLLLDQSKQNLEYHSTCGFLSNHVVENHKLAIDHSIAGRAVIEQQSLVITDIWNSNELPEGAMFVNDSDKYFNTYYAILLHVKDSIKGVLEVYLSTTPDSEKNLLPFFRTIANQLAIMIDNAQAFEVLQQRIVELTLAYDVTISRIAHSINQRDNAVSLYTQSVADMTEKLAKRMGADEQALVHIRRGALLHYISKLSLPEKILQKPGPLTDKEWDIMRRLPGIAQAMFSDIKLLRPALDIPVYHHEKWDGSGYPYGLHGEEIPLAARQFAVVDVYHALLTERPYRPSWDEIDVLEYIHSQSGTQFDPRVVTTFLEMKADEKK